MPHTQRNLYPAKPLRDVHRATIRQLMDAKGYESMAEIADLSGVSYRLFRGFMAGDRNVSCDWLDAIYRTLAALRKRKRVPKDGRRTTQSLG